MPAHGSPKSTHKTTDWRLASRLQHEWQEDRISADQMEALRILWRMRDERATMLVDPQKVYFAPTLLGLHHHLVVNSLLKPNGPYFRQAMQTASALEQPAIRLYAQQVESNPALPNSDVTRKLKAQGLPFYTRRELASAQHALTAMELVPELVGKLVGMGAVKPMKVNNFGNRGRLRPMQPGEVPDIYTHYVFPNKRVQNGVKRFLQMTAYLPPEKPRRRK